MRNYQNPKEILSAEETATEGLSAKVKDFRHIAIEVSMVAYTGTVKIAGSFKETDIDFSSASSPSNPFDYIQIKDLEDASAIDGDTGISGTATTDVRLFEANVNALTWITAITSSVSGGSVTVRIIPFND